MEKEASHIAYKILNLTLEIICLLTGENCPPVMSDDHVTIPVPSSHSLISEGLDKQKILEVTRKMIELLTGEVPIRCQDVTVYFSMEEWQYLEEHQDLYKDAMMVDYKSLTTPGASAMEKSLEEDWIHEDDDLPDTNNQEDSFSVNGSFIHNKRDQEFARYTCKIIMENPNLAREDVFSTQDQKQVQLKTPKLEPFPSGKVIGPCVETLIPTGHTKVPSGHSADGPLSQKHGLLPLMDNLSPSDGLPCITSYIKEEPISDEEEELQHPDIVINSDCSQPTSTSMKDDPWEEGDFMNMGLYTHHGQYMATHIKVESALADGIQKRWPCYECGKTLSTRSNLFVHQRSHKRKKPFICVECGKGFSSRGYLVIHRRNHTGERPFSCPECGESYMAKSQLLRHQTKYHSTKRFVCGDCGRCFIVRSALNEHRKIHSGEKPFSCAECGRCFNRKSNLMSHYKIHTGEKPHRCPDCTKSFTTKSVLRAHQRVHMGLKFRS
ncbi:oocyte zinc finger protein XlCOF8.4-like [Hyperolius riggenbachi]|uniref:oocyte zinc finger protein XlCOF8.4-like n=1 Tax=Hyperolius riggenbachi TaxID=752182 RepID=UPI0035A3D47A